MTRLRAIWGSVLLTGRTLWSGISAGAGACLRALGWLAVKLLGRWHWQAPAWLGWAGARATRARRYLAANPARATFLAIAVISAGAGIFWYANRPKPHYVTFTVNT
jgi:hypothetical protein